MVDLRDITDEEISSVLAWYYESNTATTSLKKDYWGRKKKGLMKKLGWKFSVILVELVQAVEETGKEKGA